MFIVLLVCTPLVLVNAVGVAPVQSPVSLRRYFGICTGPCVLYLHFKFILFAHSFVLNETQHRTHCAFPGGATAGGKSQTAVIWNISS
jgi:hypothetical protein